MSRSHERDPLLAKNQTLEVNDCVDYGILKLQVPNERDPEDPTRLKILSYNNEKAHTFLAIFQVTGTSFSNGSTWLTCFFYWLTSFLVCLLNIKCRTLGVTSALLLQEPKQQEAFADLTKYFTAIVAFMIGLFVSHMVNRWWCMRNLVCDLFNVVHDLMCRVSVRMKDASDRKYLETMLRFCLLSHRLIYFQARGEEGEGDLRKLIHVGLMSDEELAALKDKQGKPLVVWMWIQALFQSLVSAGKLKDLSPPVLARFDGLFGGASVAINRIFTYIDTQVPFPYVHVLTFMVVMNNLLISVKAGILAGNAEGPGGYPDTAVVLLEVVHVVLVPFVYHSFLSMGFELANPFGSDVVDLPGHTLNVLLRDTELACIDAVEKPPSSTKVTEDPEKIEKV